MNRDAEPLVAVAEAEHRHREPINEVLSYRGIGTLEDPEEFDELISFLSEEENSYDRKKLDARQKMILREWSSNGVRFDTAHWLRSLAVHFGDHSLLKPRTIIAALFIDTYNRADDVMDTFRDKFADASGHVTTKNLRTLPILKLSDNTTAAVGDFMDITQRLIKTSGAYSGQEVIALNRGIKEFLQQSREAIEQIEKAGYSSSIEYGEEEAVSLRQRTLYPLVTLVCQIYGSSEHHDSFLEDTARGLEHEMRALAMAAQVLDDTNDFIEDYQNGNTNIAIGVVADCCRFRGRDVNKEFFDTLHRERYSSDEGDEEVYAEIYDITRITEKRLEQLYEHFYNQLNPHMQRFMPSPYNIRLHY